MTTAVESKEEETPPPAPAKDRDPDPLGPPEEEPLDIEDHWADRIDFVRLGRLSSYVMARRNLFVVAVGTNLALTLMQLASPQIVKVAVDRYIAHGDMKGLAWLAALFAVISLAMWHVMRLAVSRSVGLGQTVMNDLRQEIFRHIQILSASFFDKTKAGRIISRVDGDLMGMEQLLTWGASDILTSLATLAGALAMMFWYSWRLALPMLLLLPTMVLGTILFERKGIVVHRRMRESYSRLTSNLAENISGVRVVQSFAREEQNLERFVRLVKDHVNNGIRAGRVWGVYWPFLSLHAGIGNVIILAYGAHLVRAGGLQIGELIAFQLYLMMFFGPINLMGEVYNGLLAASASADRIFSLLDTAPEVRDAPGATALPRIEGRVEFRDVFFRYGPPLLSPAEETGQVRWTLEDINFSVPAGSVCALVGHTGSGKSTIVNLIARFYECQRGAVLIDGCDVKSATIQSLHTQMGIVLQQVFLFSGTVMENIRYGRPGATDDEVIQCARTLGSHDVIMNLAKGYQTSVKERGQGLSQGERQLISFTRAMLANPRILMLDEATSAVDTRTQAVIQEALGRLLAGRTAFVVAHRLSTIRRADLLLIIDKGRIVERGTHESLLRAGGTYANLYRQFISGV